MKAWQTKKGTQIMQLLNKSSNVYLIITKDFQVLVDTGKTSAYDKLYINLEALSDSTCPLKHLFLTHSHYDHCQNAAQLKDKYQYKIWLSEKEEGFAKNGFTPLPKGTNLFSNWISILGQNLPKKNFSYPVFFPDVLIKEDGILESEGLKIILSPGHTDGSISIIVDEEIAIVGDALFGIFKNSVMPPFADDKKMMLQSWEKLLNTRAQLFLPGHGKEIERKLLQKELIKYQNQ